MALKHFEASALVRVAPAALFDRLDDQRRLGGHMAKSSMMMGGGRMTYAFDAGEGRAVGSHITMGGSAFGLNLSVEEVVTRRDPPRRKVWKTVGRPQLLVIDAYEMGFAIDPVEAGSRLRVWINYEPPERGLGRWLPVVAAAYARWCVGRMLKDAGHLG